VVIDSSAVVAILENEPERARFDRLIASDEVRLMSAVGRVECTCVVEGRRREPGRAALERFLSEAAIEVVAVTPEQAQLACEAFRRFGKGRHPAALNIGGCFAYALTKATGEPLLCKGDDFPQTDLRLVD
jgi:ribonuclease VapC